jgi:uncharacterized protein YjlB
MTIETRHNWYLIQSDPRMMELAAAEITARGVEFLWPQTWRRVIVDGQPRAVPSARLPGNYAFVRLQYVPTDSDDTLLNDQAAAILSLRGVREVYRNARGHYSAVQAWEIQALKDVDAADRREAVKARPKFTNAQYKPGCAVRVLRGNAEGQSGEFLFSVRGMATVAVGNGIKLSVPECDITEIAAGNGARLSA